MRTTLFTLAALLCLPAAAAPDAGADAGPPPWSVEDAGFPGRDVPIDVTEGTWMNVDVSPQGDRLVFDLLGDLYVLPLSGGEAKAVTHGAAWDMHPRFSPDGTQLAFTSDRGGGDNLWLVPLDGGAPAAVSTEKHRLVSSPAWAPNGDFVVGRKHFTSRRSIGAGELWLYHRAGGEGVQLTEKPTDQKDVGEPCFSPDGKALYFSQDVTPGKAFEYNKDPNGEIYAIFRLDLATKELRRFVSGPGGSVRPTPSPDGKVLAFVRRVRGKSVLMVADVASGAEWTITDGLDRDLQEAWAIHGVAPAMAWTPDSRAIVFSARGKLWRVEVKTGKVANIPFHVKDTRFIADALHFSRPAAPSEVPVQLTRGAQTSPSGDAVVYEALGYVWRKALPGGVPKRLTKQTGHREFAPSYARDGKTIVYATWDDESLGAVRQVASAGGEGRLLTRSPGHYLQPVLSPDGKVLVYRTQLSGLTRSALWSRDPGLYAQRLDGSTPRLLTREGSAPHFGAEVDRVYFLTVKQEPKEDIRSLNSIALDGSDERTHLTSDEATEYQVSPDGRYLAFKENHNAFVMPFPLGAKVAVASPETKALPVVKVSKDAGSALHWSGDGKSLAWSWGRKLHTVALKDAFAFLGGSKERVEAAQDALGVDLGFFAKADAVKGVVAFVGGRLVTMKGDEVVEDGTLVLRDGRIAAVGPRASTPVPRGAHVIDARGTTLLPGLVDVHWHGSVGNDGIIPEQNWTLQGSLAFGLTTAHDPSNDTETFFAAAQLQRTGALLSPRLFSTGTILYGAQGAFRAPIETLDDARSHLRRMKDAGAFSVKSYNQPRRDQRQKVLAAARELGMLVVPEGGSLLQHNLTMVVDGHTGVEHAVPVAPVYEDVLQLWSQSRTGYTPTLGVAYGGLMGENYFYLRDDVWADERLSRFVPRRVLDERSRRRTKLPDEELNHIAASKVAQALSARGVSVQLGAHGQREGLAAHWELEMLVQGGMTPHQALRAGTLAGATYLGFEKDLGSLEVGKLADVIVVAGNPLQDIRQSKQVRTTVLGGRVYDAATMDEVWPRKVKRAPFFFERTGGEAWAPGVSVGHAED